MKTPHINLTLLYMSMVLLVIPLYSCSSGKPNVQPSNLPPSGFSEADLIGTWQESGAADSDEIIILSNDHKYRQIFNNVEASYHAELEGTWEQKNSKTGCVYIYFYGMKYFYQEQELVDNGNRWASGMKKGDAEKYWDECSKDVIEMPNMVVMFVGQHPDFTKNIVLREMATQRDVVDIYFSLPSTPP